MKFLKLILLVLLKYSSNCLSCKCNENEEFAKLKFPKNFQFGVASSAYQTEGAWNEDGKGMNQWDNFTHQYPERITNNDNGDISADSYHKYQQDIDNIHEIGFDFYRFSISWSRILPDGTINHINSKGLQYYHKLIDGLLLKGIKPMVTIYHFDLPQALLDQGGWLNRTIIKHYIDYCDLLFINYGEKVKLWVTVNEPIVEQVGYADKDYFPPSWNGHGVYNYIVVHHMILAHASAYRLYERKYKEKQKGMISFVTLVNYCYPASNSSEDVLAAERKLQFETGWFAHAICSKDGDYPAVMRQYIDRNSAEEHRNLSRLPTFTRAEVEFIRGTYDFFGLNYYTPQVCQNGIIGDRPSYERDSAVLSGVDISWPPTAAKYFQNYPEGFTDTIRWISKEYDYPDIFITENGYAETDVLNDQLRIDFIQRHLLAVVKSMEEGAKVLGYTVYSLQDNFEWLEGYSINFGLIRVNMSDPNRARTMRRSAEFFQKFIRYHKCCNS